MIIYILKFSACLALFLVFYKLVLEKENMHVFKRFYLLGTLLLSIGIPLITFTYYVEPSTEIVSLENTISEFQPQTNYLPIILMFIYSLGVILFGYKFIKNLFQLNYKIKHNPKLRRNSVTNVLLQDLIVPHTFFSFIFFNKQKFVTHKIPKEVIWHEETHAIQKHSIDVLFIEILQIVFWFNPLIYIIKHVIKLNHEFLADQAVLKMGVETATYQETLLAFSSNASHPQLANAINYSSIKKRFTVMKTKTTKSDVWLRSIVLLPFLSFMLYGFSDKEIIHIEKDSIIKLQLKTIQQKATKDQIAEYNKLAKKYNNMSKDNMFIKSSDLERIKYLYHLMNVEQRKKAQPFPSFPAPPPPPAPPAPKAKQPDLPPPPPLPENATPKQIETYKRAYRDAQVANKILRSKAEKEELIKVKKIHLAEDVKKLKQEKLVYKETQAATKVLKAKKEQIVKVRKISSAQDRELLKQEKLVYKEAQVTARTLKLKAQKEQLVKVKEIHSAEEIEKLKAEKKAYKKSQAKAKALKNKSKKKEN